MKYRITNSTILGSRLVQKSSILWASHGAGACRPLCAALYRKVWPSERPHFCPTRHWKADGEQKPLVRRYILELSAISCWRENIFTSFSWGNVEAETVPAAGLHSHKVRVHFLRAGDSSRSAIKAASNPGRSSGGHSDFFAGSCAEPTKSFP